MNARRVAAFALLLAAACGVAAQTTVYRCGDGRTFSQVPCAGGRALVVDGRSDASAHEAARAVAGRDAALAERLAQERRAREAEGFAQRQAAGFAMAPRADDAPAGTRRENRRVKAPKAPPTSAKPKKKSVTAAADD
jgi:hypothetical protein